MTEHELPTPTIREGDRVEKFTGDYRLQGTVVAVFTTVAGKLRFVVDHTPAVPGLLHIYSEQNIRKVSND